MDSIFNEIADEIITDYVCRNPKTFVQFLECNYYTVILIAICVFLFFLGIEILIKVFEIHDNNNKNDGVELWFGLYY